MIAWYFLSVTAIRMKCQFAESWHRPPGVSCHGDVYRLLTAACDNAFPPKTMCAAPLHWSSFSRHSYHYTRVRDILTARDYVKDTTGAHNYRSVLTWVDPSNFTFPRRTDSVKMRKQRQAKTAVRCNESYELFIIDKHRSKNWRTILTRIEKHSLNI